MASSQRVMPGNSVPTVEEFRVWGAWFTVPVPKLVILADIPAPVPVVLVNGPLAAIGKLEDVVVKLCELDAQTPFASAELAARTR